MPTMSLSHKLRLFSNFIFAGRFREIYNMFWVYPLWWNKKIASFLLNRFLPKLGIDLFPPFLEIEPTTVCNFRCVCCVPKGTILIGSVQKQIEDFTKNDFVYNQKGKEQKILDTFQRDYNGDIIEIKAEGILPISLTSEHKVLVSKREWVGRPRKDRKYKYSENLEFIEAEKLNRDYALVFPKLNESNDLKEINGFGLTKELLRFLGIYTAEGYVCTSKRTLMGKIIGNHGTIRLCFGKHETKLINETRELINKIFNKKPLIIERETSTNIHFSSVEIAKWLSQFGKNSIEKKIPEFIMLLNDKELIKSFIEGFIEGDGYINSKYIQLTTSSKILALQLQKLLSKIDIFGRLYVNKREGESFIQGRKVNIHDLYNIRITTPDFYKFLNIENKSKRKIRNYEETKDYFFLPIKNISKMKYSGMVYNLETEDKTFELNNTVIHNCEHSYWKEQSKNITFEQFKKMFDGFGRPKWLGLTGIGSSYLNKDYHKMLAYAKSRGTIIEVFDHFAHFRSDAEIRELIEIGPDFQFISTYGATPKSFEKVCRGSNYAIIEKNIKRFVELKKQMKKRFPILSFHYIITKDSKDEILQFLDFIHSLDTDIGEVLITPMLHGFKEAEKYAVEIDENYVSKVRERAKKYGIPITVNMSAKQDSEGLERKPPIRNCKEYIMPFIFVTGHVTPCCAQNEDNQRDWQKKLSLGNALEQPFREIWYSPRYRAMRKAIRQNKVHPACSHCPAYELKNPLSPQEFL